MKVVRGLVIKKKQSTGIAYENKANTQTFKPGLKGGGRPPAVRGMKQRKPVYKIPWLQLGRGGTLDRENQVGPNTIYVRLEQNLKMMR